jgi:hypothetical protein
MDDNISESKSIYEEETFDRHKNEDLIEFAVIPMMESPSYQLIKNYLDCLILCVNTFTKMADLKDFVLNKLNKNHKLKDIRRQDIQFLAL